MNYEDKSLKPLCQDRLQTFLPLLHMDDLTGFCGLIQMLHTSSPKSYFGLSLTLALL